MTDTAQRAAEQAARLHALGRYTDAEATLRAGLAEHPDDPVLLAALSNVLHLLKRPTEALQVADAAIAAAPQHERAYRFRALTLSELGRHEQALHAAQTAVTLDPHGKYPVLVYAFVLRRAGRCTEAWSVAQRLLTLAPDWPAAHTVFGDIARDCGDQQTARRAYQQVLRLDPQHAKARNALAGLDFATHELGHALQGFIEAGRLDPQLAVVLRNVAAVLWRVSWRLRIWLILAVVTVALGGLPDPGQPSWSTRALAALVLLTGVGVSWFSSRDLPRHTWPVIKAALRSDPPLLLTYLALTLAATLYLAVAVTGIAAIGSLVGLILCGLGVLAVIVRLTRNR